MRRWFAALPVHRKIVAIVLAVSTAAVGAAVVGLLVFLMLRGFVPARLMEAQALALGDRSQFGRCHRVQ